MKFWYVILAIVAVAVLMRTAFQWYRRFNRRCTHCFSRNIDRWHERELYMNRGPDADGFYRVDCTTYYECNESCCMDRGKPIPVKAYVKVVRARWYSIRHHRYKGLLSTTPSGGISFKVTIM